MAGVAVGGARKGTANSRKMSGSAAMAAPPPSAASSSQVRSAFQSWFKRLRVLSFTLRRKLHLQISVDNFPNVNGYAVSLANRVAAAGANGSAAGSRNSAGMRRS